MARYFLKGSLKLEGGRLYEVSGGKYVLDFYWDNEQFCTAENECSEEEAKEEFARRYGSLEGFYSK